MEKLSRQKSDYSDFVDNQSGVAMQDERALFISAQKGDEASRETLFSMHTGLIHHVVKRYIGRGCDAEDLFQLGAIGLVKAIQHFDVDYGVCFSTYAVPMIAGEIRRFLRDDGMIKISRSIKENQWKIKQKKEELLQRMGREPTLQELSDVTQISVEDIVIALESGREVESIYQTVYQADGNEVYLIDQIHQESGHAKGTNSQNTEGERVINKVLIEELMSMLNQTESTLIQLRFFENKTQTQVAQSLGMSQVQVSRLEKKVLLHMKNACAL